jgi:hypothetical protein
VNSTGKTSALMLTLAYCLVHFAGAIQPGQKKTFRDKSFFLISGITKRPNQENSRYKYVGMEKCALVCHNNKEMGFQYDIVKNSPHPKAYSALSSVKAAHYCKNAHVRENPKESLVCLKCHVTGGGLDSSSFASTYKKEDGVTCEACHKGEFITKTFLPEESDCVKCHNNSVHKTRKFNFKDGCAKIAHPRPKVKSV